MSIFNQFPIEIRSRWLNGVIFTSQTAKSTASAGEMP